MTNSDLQAALIPLAEKAGYEVSQYDSYGTWYKLGTGRYEPFPDADGTLEGEVELVLGWLAKAGYGTTIGNSLKGESFMYRCHIDIGTEMQSWAFKDTLHAALAAAVIALNKSTS